MRKFALIAALALTASLALSACGKHEDAQQAGPQATQQATKPTDPNDVKAWNAYLGQIVQNNMQGMKADRPYPYLVPAGDSDEAVAGRGRQLSNVEDTVARGVLPGNMLVFAGPDSAKTADLIAAAFKDAKPGSFKDVIVLFIGDKADEQRVDDVLKPTGATVRFVAM
ncbi:putative small secreted protein [Rhodanobacter sp. TND4EL1]